MLHFDNWLASINLLISATSKINKKIFLTLRVRIRNKHRTCRVKKSSFDNIFYLAPSVNFSFEWHSIEFFIFFYYFDWIITGRNLPEFFCQNSANHKPRKTIIGKKFGLRNYHFYFQNFVPSESSNRYVKMSINNFFHGWI